MRSIPVGISSVSLAGVPCARRSASAIRDLKFQLACAVAVAAMVLPGLQPKAFAAPAFRPGHADAPPLLMAQLRLGGAGEPAPVAAASAAPLRASLAAGEPEGAASPLKAGPAIPPEQKPQSPPASGVSRLPAFIAAMQRLAPPQPTPAPSGRAPVLTRAPMPAIAPGEPEIRIATPPPIRGSVIEGRPVPEVLATGSLPAAGAITAGAEPMPPPLAPAVGPGVLAAMEMPKPRRARSAAVRGGMRLSEAVASAVMSFPEIRINEARLREAAAGINASRAGLFPNADLRLAAGHNFSGNYEGREVPYKTASGALDNRLDAGLILRQLVFDFGATRADIRRAEFLRDSEKLKLRDKVEDVAHRTTQNFLKVLEQREMLGLIDEIIAAHEHLARIVEAHAREGHGTLADVNRVSSRLIDVRAMRSDISLQLMAAEEQFQRLTKRKPGGLADVPDLARVLPNAPQEAIQRVIAGSPRLGAIAASRQSAQQELAYQRASNLPRINLEIDGETKNFRSSDLGVVSSPGRTQIEGRAMLAMRYRLMDGGLASATRDQINARIEGNDMTYQNEREQMEADVRQSYRAMESARRKGRLVADGVISSDRVRDLYLEQFKGGKRTIFELLDGQMAYYTARRNQIESQYEGRRAAFDVLRAMGELTSTLANAR